MTRKEMEQNEMSDNQWYLNQCTTEHFSFICFQLSKLCHCNVLIKWKQKILKSDRKIVARGKIDTSSTHIRSLTWLGTGTLIKSGGIKSLYGHLVKWCVSMKWFLRVSKMPTLTYNRANVIIIKITIIWSCQWLATSR